MKTESWHLPNELSSIFVAYLSMLDNYSSLNMWLNDTDTSGVLGHILRTYHEEKHISAINQFSVVL